MPNHCRNYLDVRGPQEHLRRFAKAAEGLRKDSEELDLTRFFPEPKELLDIKSGVMTINGQHYTAWRTHENEKGESIAVGIGAVESRMLKKKYGADNLYEWHINTFGTKWNVYDVSVEFFDDHIRYVFNTAWSPFSENVLNKMAMMFPMLSFTLKYGERGGGFYGAIHAAKGGIQGTDEGTTEGKWIATPKKGKCKECGEGPDDCWGHYDVGKFSDPEYVELLESSG